MAAWVAVGLEEANTAGTRKTRGQCSFSLSQLHFCCWAHLRRKFFEASKLDGWAKRSVAVVAGIGKLYQVKRRAREALLTELEREAFRQRKCPALVASVKVLVVESAAVALPRNALGKACIYALEEWERLESYAGAVHGMVEGDNHWPENSVRPIAHVRHSWIQMGNDKAGPKMAAILSVLKTSPQIGVNDRQYILEVWLHLFFGPMRSGLEGLPAIEELTPAGWKRAREVAGAALA